MRHFAAAEIDAALDFPSLIDALAESDPRRIPRARNAIATRSSAPGEADGDDAADAGVDRGAAPAPANILASRSSMFSRQFGARHAGGARPLRPAVRRHRRAARHDRRNAADAVAHRRRLGAGGAPSRARRREAPADRRRRRSSRHSSPAPTPACGRSKESRYGTTVRRARVGSPRPQRARGSSARAAERLEVAVREADIISCATLSEAPLVAGAWLEAGQHLDLVGALNMRCARPTTRR